MNQSVSLQHVLSMVEKTCSKQWGVACTDAVQTAIRSLPRTESCIHKHEVFQSVTVQIEHLVQCLNEQASSMKDAEIDDIVALQRSARLLTDQVEKLANLKDNHLMKQLQSIRVFKS